MRVPSPWWTARRSSCGTITATVWATCLKLLAWNQGIGFFSSEIGPSALLQAYKLIKNGEKQGKSREDICSALREKFGEKNPEMQVLNK